MVEQVSQVYAPQRSSSRGPALHRAGSAMLAADGHHLEIGCEQLVQNPSHEPVWHGWYLLSFGVKCFLKRRLCMTRPRSRPFDGTYM
jgi:hypothetical protein